MMASKHPVPFRKYEGASFIENQVCCACEPKTPVRLWPNHRDGSKFYACSYYDFKTKKSRCAVKFEEYEYDQVKAQLASEQIQTPSKQKSLRQLSLEGMFLPTPSNTRTPTTGNERHRDFSNAAQATPSTDTGRPTTSAATQGGNKKRMQDVGDERTERPFKKKLKRQLFPSSNGRNVSLENSSTNIENGENKSKDSTARSLAGSRQDVGVQSSGESRTRLAEVKNMNKKFGEA